MIQDVRQRVESLRLPIFLMLAIGILLVGCSIGKSGDATPTSSELVFTAATPTPGTATATPTAKSQPVIPTPPATQTRPPATATTESPEPATEMELEEACRVTDAIKLGEGGDQDWSHDSNMLVYDKVDENGVYQLHTSLPDGSAMRCLTCSPSPGAPAAERHKFNPAWHPSEEYAVVQVEKEMHPLTAVHTEPLISELLLNGLWNDLYVLSTDGSAWHQITRTAPDRTDGVLAPAFSPDGSMLMWSQLVESVSEAHPWGVFRLMLADFRIEHGIPQVTNIRDITPAAMTGRFVQSHVISPDGSLALVSSDLGASNKMHMHVYRIDLDTLEPTRVSRDETWNEHATFTPDGQHIVYMAGVPGYLFSTDLVMVNLDGSGWTQLTHFNDPGYPEYAGELTLAARPRFSPDGSRAVVTTQSVTRYPARDLWIITFAGQCGGSANAP